MQAVRVQHFLQRATDFSRGIKLMRNEQQYFNSSALLAIHCAISYADALRSGLGEQNLAGEDHGKAADALQKLLPPDIKNDKGLEQFRKLLARKTRVAYSDRRLSRTEAEDLVLAAERFETWANDLGKQLNLEGWMHDDQ